MTARPQELSVFLPAWNEAGNVARVVSEVCGALERMDLRAWEVIVVDDGSTDATPDIVAALSANDARIRHVRHMEKRGYGAALRTGFGAARLQHVFYTDGDGQFVIDDLEAVLDHAARADVVVGYRARRQDPWWRRASGAAWTLLVDVLFGLRVRDVDCAFKLMRKCDLERIGPLESTGAMVSTELLWKLRRAGCTIHQLPVRHRPRIAGEASGGSPAVIWHAVRELVRFRFETLGRQLLRRA